VLLLQTCWWSSAGRCRLAQLVQYVPLPVVGGYLGYVGYFCVAGGLGLGCNVQVSCFFVCCHVDTMAVILTSVVTRSYATHMGNAVHRLSLLD
jgi:MFS superfamily sulfate permease-like transporter